MKNKRKSRPDVLKMIRYGIVLMIILYTGMLLYTKGNRDTAFETVASAVEKAADTEKLTKAGSRELKRLYRLNDRDYESVVLYYTNETMGVEELLLVKADTDEAIETVEDAVLERRQIQMDNFNGYGTEQMKLLQNSIIKVKGDYVLFVVSPKAEAVEEAFIKIL